MTQMFAVIRVGTNERERTFDTGKEAADHAKNWNEFNKRQNLPDRYRVVPLSDDEVSDIKWKRREESRLADGTYKRVPWASYMLTIDQDIAQSLEEHYTHVSKDDPTMLAYTPDAIHGRADRQVRIRPGKYLASLGYVSENDIKHWCTQWVLQNAPCELKFSGSDPDAIEHIYRNGPRSCMAYGINDYDSDVHPTRVYGAGDLELAYLEPEEDHITARALVWRAKGVYGRIYGDQGRLEPMLEAAGLIQAERDGTNFDGARLLKIECDDSYVMPYLDDPTTMVDDYGDHFIIRQNGEMHARNTNGLLDTGSRCCQCGERVDDDDIYTNDDGDNYCRDCWDENYFSCTNCGHDIRRDDVITDAAGDDWCERCAGNHLIRCYSCDEYHASDNCAIGPDDEAYCETCFDEKFTHCEDCNEAIRHDDAIHHDGCVYCEDCAPNEEETEDEQYHCDDPRQCELPLAAD